MKPATLLEPGTLDADDAPAHAAEAHPGLFADLCELTKARLTSLVLVTTLAGFYLGWDGPMNYGRLLNAMLGTALVAAGAGALNQLLERGPDAPARVRCLPGG